VNPLYEAAYYNRGCAYSDKGNLDQAISDFARAIELRPQYANAYYNRACAYVGMGNVDKALSDFTKAEELGCKVDAKLIVALRAASEKELLASSKMQ
jgi:tetratricopeptide (TPR) repeat protein